MEKGIEKWMAKMCKRYGKVFVKVAAIVLLVTGFAKTWSSFGSAKVLIMRDPILFLSYRNLLLAVGLGEVLLAFVCLFSRVQLKTKVQLIAWMATNFLIYRIGLWCVGWSHPCGCLGDLAAALHIPDDYADYLMKIVLVFLLAGSYLLILTEFLKGSKTFESVGQHGNK